MKNDILKLNGDLVLKSDVIKIVDECIEELTEIFENYIKSAEKAGGYEEFYEVPVYESLKDTVIITLTDRSL